MGGNREEQETLERNVTKVARSAQVKLRSAAADKYQRSEKMTAPKPGFDAHFGINNIPFGIASSKKHFNPTCVSRYEDNVIFLDDLPALFGNITDLPGDVFHNASLNKFAALPRSVHQYVRRKLQDAIRKGLPPGCSEHIADVNMHLPVDVGDFTDFSCSLDHVQNASEAMTGVRSSPPAFFHMPVGYAGRCSSLIVSGTDVRRPVGQYWAGKPGHSDVVFGPSRKMDYELEIAAVIGQPVPRGDRVRASEAEQHIFGYCLINDWSARDIQGLEMNPLGPLNGKNAGTTVSPWIVTVDALEPFKTSSPARLRNEASYLATLKEDSLDINLEVRVSQHGMKNDAVTCRSNSSQMYWTLSQCVAHQAIGGCGLRTGDLVASGTVSGGSGTEHGCLMEFMKHGSTPPRGYIEDGETVTLTGFCSDGVGFGECTSTLTPATAVT